MLEACTYLLDDNSIFLLENLLHVGNLLIKNMSILPLGNTIAKVIDVSWKVLGLASKLGEPVMEEGQ